ncbi:uncharacterized protein V1516DRAFT_676940 [Lipomyces oligophaga]|uniref:uncharacterized protein n=1 Tax=Lipomyces oligophaga TaxID=45792 RepID=UPI0034CDBFFE
MRRLRSQDRFLWPVSAFDFARLFIVLLFCFASFAATSQNSSNRRHRDPGVALADIYSPDPRPQKQPRTLPNKSPATDGRIGHSIASQQGAAFEAPVLGDQRQIDDWKLEDFLLIATVDGSLHACERDTGTEIWTLEGEESVVKAPPKNPLASKTEDDDITWIVEPLGDGALYYFKPDTGLQKLPISIKQLVAESPFSIFGDDKVYTGSRSTTLYSVDAHNGKVLKVYGSGSASPALCPNDIDDFDDDDWDNIFGSHETFLVGRTEYRLQIESRVGSKDSTIWNVTYSSWVPNNMDADLLGQHTVTPDNLYVYPLHDGAILAVDRFNESRSWSRVLPSPAITTFDVFAPYEHNGHHEEPFVILPQPKLHEVHHGPDSTSLSTFVSKTNDGGWYALSAQYFPILVKTAPIARWNLGIMTPDSENPQQSLIGVHDGKRSSFIPLRGIEAPHAQPAPQIDGSERGYAKQNFSLPLRALYDVILATPLLAAGFIYLQRKHGISVTLSQKSSMRDYSNSESMNSKSATDTADRASNDIQFSYNNDPVAADASAEPDTTNKLTVQAGNITPVKKRKRGTRGGRRANTNKDSNDRQELVADKSNNSEGRLRIISAEGSSGSLTHKINSLEVTDSVLGYGSHGTVVYKGMFENREVAVKRMLLDFYDVASHEVSLLQESDDHPNVVRYFCKQESEKFLYIALELCPATLQDIVDRPQDFEMLTNHMDPQKVLYQIANGLQYLHSLKIVHRDIKPQNILVAPPKARRDVDPSNASVRLLISDFGLCKKLEGDQSSFRATTAHAAGTSGWRAPELLIEAEESTGTSSTHTLSQSNQHTGGSTSEPAVIDPLSNRRATRAIDIFSLGCVFYFVLSNGSHPFGDRYLREANIVKGEFSLDYLEALGYQGVEGRDLIERMLDRDPKNRPTAAEVMIHPFFWSNQKRLDFLLEVSDRFEIEPRDPPSILLEELESEPQKVVYNDWYKRLDKSLIENLGKYRKYHTDKVLDLLRALRNKKHHYQDLPPNVQQALGTVPDGFLAYFAQRFPNLLMHVYHVVSRNLRDEQQFRPYFTV